MRDEQAVRADLDRIRWHQSVNDAGVAPGPAYRIAGDVEALLAALAQLREQIAKARQIIALTPWSMSLGEMNAYEAKGLLPYIQKFIELHQVLDSPSTVTQPDEQRPPVGQADNGRAAMTTLVRQEHDYGCGIASLAMCTGETYDDVRLWLLANWPGGQGDHEPDKWLTERGIHKGVVDYYLALHGYVWRTLYCGWDLPVWPPEPFAPVHLACVVQPSGNTHYVVMRADGVVLDPMTDEPRSLSDWPKINNVQGICPDHHPPWCEDCNERLPIGHECEAI